MLQDDQNANDQSIGIIKEAKEWAGELLSGQTKVIVIGLLVVFNWVS